MYVEDLEKGIPFHLQTVGETGEGGEGEVWRQLRQLQMENDQLRTSLEGGVEGEGKGEKVQEQMACILRVIDNGVQSGQLKVGAAVDTALEISVSV